MGDTTDNKTTAKIKEIFTSIQGEGVYVGFKQLFIRFCTCNLHCKYCDTLFRADDNTKCLTPKELYRRIEDKLGVHSISLTGGEPLCEWRFLKEFLPLIREKGIKIYLETNATLYNELKEIIDFIDIISADIKIPSSCGIEGLLEKHDKFFSICERKCLFAKIVFNTKLTDTEIEKSASLAKKYGIELILQPEMDGNKLTVNGEFISKTLDKYLKIYDKVRVIPQTHKFINIE